MGGMWTFQLKKELAVEHRAENQVSETDKPH